MKIAFNFKKMDRPKIFIKTAGRPVCLRRGRFYRNGRRRTEQPRRLSLGRGEIFLYQLRRRYCGQIQEDGKTVDVPIREGEMFLLRRAFRTTAQTPSEWWLNANVGTAKRQLAVVLRKLQQRNCMKNISTSKTSRHSFKGIQKNFTPMKHYEPVKNYGAIMQPLRPL